MSTSSASSHARGPPHSSHSHSHGHQHQHQHHHAHRHRALSLASARSRDEARLGITTEYKDLSLHSAAANGNLGLVQYALSHGQPVNSVLNGVLPLHAAASSGNETVVRMLIEAGADVNSPRLSRRYTREGSKPSGVSVGSNGSTPLHFAAANGHIPVLKLLLSYGADPRKCEKHGLTPAQMALTNGHHDACALLRAWAVQLDDADSAASEAASLVSTRGGGGPPSIRSTLSLTRRAKGPGGVHPQRSFDALATKLAHAAPAGRASTSSLHSLASLASSSAGASPALGSASPASSQISLGAVGSGAQVVRRASAHSEEGREDAARGPAPRRPSLPSVWEKAAHPRAAFRQAFGRNGGTRAGVKRAPSSAGGRSVTSLLSDEALYEEEDYGGSASEGDGDEGAERAERRRSLEVHRPLRHDPWHGAGAAERLEPIDDDEGSDDDVPTPVQTRAPQLPLVPPQPPPPPSTPPAGTLTRVSSHHFYRPRQSSQLSKSSFSDRRPSLDGDDEGSSVFHDEATPPPTAPNSPPTSPRRPRAVSNPNPQSGTRSPLLQQVQLSQQQHQHIQQLHLQRAREDSASTASSRASTAGALADGEFSSTENGDSSGASGALRSRMSAPGDVRRAFLDPAQAQQQLNRARSNSASTDGSLAARASSSPTSSFSGPTFSTYSYTPSTSSAPTSSYAPSSPGGGARARAKDAGVTAVPVALQGRLLAPVLEVRTPPLTTAQQEEVGAPQTRAQARSRVQRAEKELLASAADARSSRSGGSGASGSAATSQRSLKDQLAAYGRSLKAEKELVEREEREKRGRKEVRPAQGYTFETIKSAAVDSTPSLTKTTPPKPTAPAPARAVSPASTRSGSCQSSTASGGATPAVLAPPVPVYGQGHGGVSFVGVGAKAPPAPAGTSSSPLASPHMHAHVHGAQSRTSRSDRSRSEGGGVGTGPPRKTRDQVEEDRKEQERLASAVPRAVRTVPSGRKGLKRWFGAGGKDGGEVK
ncbi:hypothetical protein JCM10450v2_006480 [Rhodotorula kratochvilovae]